MATSSWPIAALSRPIVHCIRACLKRCTKSTKRCPRPNSQRRSLPPIPYGCAQEAAQVPHGGIVVKIQQPPRNRFGVCVCRKPQGLWRDRERSRQNVLFDAIEHRRVVNPTDTALSVVQTAAG